MKGVEYVVFISKTEDDTLSGGGEKVIYIIKPKFLGFTRGML